MKKIQQTAAIFCTTLFLGASIGSAAAQNLVEAKDLETILDVAKGFGSASLDKDSQGDPVIQGRSDGIKYSINFYDCKPDVGCWDMQFMAGWSNVKVSLDAINDWNRETRYGKAYLDKDSDPNLKMAVNVKHGVSRKNLEDTFDWWFVALKDFKKDVVKD